MTTVDVTRKVNSLTMTPAHTHYMQCQKFERKDFGECPRMLCDRQAVLPVRAAFSFPLSTPAPIVPHVHRAP